MGLDGPIGPIKLKLEMLLSIIYEMTNLSEAPLVINIDDVDDAWSDLHNQRWRDDSQSWRAQADEIRGTAYARARHVIKNGKLIRWTFETIDTYENIALIDFHWITEAGTIVTTLDLGCLHPPNVTFLERVIRGENITNILKEILLVSLQDR